MGEMTERTEEGMGVEGGGVKVVKKGLKAG
jgi:hypothetical protein